MCNISDQLIYHVINDRVAVTKYELTITKHSPKIRTQYRVKIREVREQVRDPRFRAKT